MLNLLLNIQILEHSFTLIASYRAAALAGHYRVCYDIIAYFLYLSNFRVAKINGEQWVQYGGARI